MDCITKRIPQVHCHVAKKNQRETMEDRHIVAQIDLPGKGRIDLVGVFDGHGGHQAAEELINIFPEMLADKLDKLRNIHAPLAVTDALHDTVLAIDHKMYQGGGFSSGSTGVIALWPHKDNYLYIANLGNSRAIVWSGNKLIIETKDHKPRHEVERIRASGGFIRDGRVGGVLEISRSFGDFCEDLKLLNQRYLGKYAPVSPEPDVYHVDLRTHPGPVRMVLASDGLWNVMSTRETIKFFNGDLAPADDETSSAECKELVAEAVQRGSTDNITVLVVDIPRTS
jgi:serine/threonine protein phosphatase PrpC